MNRKPRPKAHAKPAPKVCHTQIIHFLFLHHYQPAIFGITKTWLKPQFTIRGFTIHYTDSEGAPRGGVALLICSDITHYPCTTTPFNSLEALAVRITGIHPPFTFIIRPFPTDGLTNLTRMDNAVIIAGDFNSHHVHWGCHNTTFRGHGLYNLILNQHLTISAPVTPTYHPSGANFHPSIMDIFISTPNIQLFNTHSLTHLDFDHLLVIATCNPTFTDIPNHHYRYNFHKSDWKLFKSTLDSSSNITELPRTPEQIDQAITTFTESI
ncbi:hypothetical protein PR048_009475 [Dryococelus australis]|uniref:Endonuclease/exonuclease/phosphatase domain-containing protein n=1 Tax=Dryococelus australis TaxID=614101 RepID=A0ABQ9HZZ7_9NEOP|nr:hypothetical protein PR048_009475 [Dryococelus australis]